MASNSLPACQPLYSYFTVRVRQGDVVERVGIPLEGPQTCLGGQSHIFVVLENVSRPDADQSHSRSQRARVVLGGSCEQEDIRYR